MVNNRRVVLEILLTINCSHDLAGRSMACGRADSREPVGTNFKLIFCSIVLGGLVGESAKGAGNVATRFVGSTTLG